MATRKQTITVPVNFGAVGTIADATLTTLGTPTIYIPENSVGNPVTFNSVAMFVALQDMSTVTGGTMTEFRANIEINGVTTTFTETDDLSNTGENWSVTIAPIDFTTAFNTNFGTVTSRACQVQIYADISTGTGLTTTAAYAWLEITYSFDDSAANRIKTIIIPFESPTGTLTTTANTTFATLPQLLTSGGWLNGYATPTIRHAWAVLKGNTNVNNNNTDCAITWGFNGAGGGGTLDSRENGLATDVYTTYLIDLSSLDWSLSNTLDLWSSLASRWANLIVDVYVTFEYVVSGSTRVLNYLEIPFEFQSFLIGTTAADTEIFTRSFRICEPGTITQRAIGVEYRNNALASTTVGFKINSQAFRSYARLSNVVGGMFTFQHLGDSRASGGSAITLTNGTNTFNLYSYAASGTVSNISGVIKILYESDVASSGVDTHVKKIMEIKRQVDFAATASNITTNPLCTIPETSYYINSLNLTISLFSTFSVFISGKVEINAGEGQGDGWKTFYVDQLTSDSELGYSLITAAFRSEVKRHPNDPELSRIDIEASRRLRLELSSTARFGIMTNTCYSSVTGTVSGTISGSAGGTVTLDCFYTDTDELFETTTRSGNGAYSFTIYDPSASYYVVARETDTLIACSKTGTPATDFNIDLNPTSGGGGEFFF